MYTNVVDNRMLLNDKPLQKVSSTKFLRVYIIQHLNWADHIQQVKSKISKFLEILTKLKYLLPQSVMLTICNNLFCVNTVLYYKVWQQ